MMFSKSKIKKLIKQKAIDVNGKVITNGNEVLKDNDIIKVGKKMFLKVHICLK